MTGPSFTSSTCIIAWKRIRRSASEYGVAATYRPKPDGTYRDVQILQRGQQVEVAALPGLILTVAEIL